MQNAKDIPKQGKPSILILGIGGAGKTTQFLTLPGKKFMYLFDPNATNTLRGADIDYEIFLPDKLSLKLTSLSKTQRKKLRNTPNPNAGAEVYNAWEKDFEDKLDSGFFDEYDVIGFDSFTTLADMVMDGVLAVNGRGGQWPQQDDYGPQMMALTNIVRTLTSLNKIVYMTGHIEMKQDETTHRVYNTPLMTGRLKCKLPLLFSELLGAEAASDQKGNVVYNLQTKPDRATPLIRTSMRDLKYKEDVTLDFSKPLIGQGLARLLKLA